LLTKQPKGLKCRFLGTVLVQFSGFFDASFRLFFRMREAAGVLLAFSKCDFGTDFGRRRRTRPRQLSPATSRAI
jgi:hypothetical protein